MPIPAPRTGLDPTRRVTAGSAGSVEGHRETEHLRVLIANERKDRLAVVAPIVAALGREVIAREIEVEGVGPVTARERPDVALVGLGESSEHALSLIERVIREAACPVILLIHAPDPTFVREASKRRGLRRHHRRRRAVTGRAKGILMERHSLDEANAFAMLRDYARANNRKLIDIANAVVDGHRLLPKEGRTPSS